jgi:hypothetical protein
MDSIFDHSNTNSQTEINYKTTDFFLIAKAASIWWTGTDSGQQTTDEQYDRRLSLILNDSSEIKYFARAIRLVQPSSAACERVFSQLQQYIRHTCDQPLEDVLEFRLLMRCNNKLESSYSLAEDRENDN